MRSHFMLCGAFWCFGAASGLVASKSLGLGVGLGVGVLVCAVGGQVLGWLYARQKGKG